MSEKTCCDKCPIMKQDDDKGWIKITFDDKEWDLCPDCTKWFAKEFDEPYSIEFHGYETNKSINNRP